jgi:calcineurin-like phosphoesterase family protein
MNLELIRRWNERVKPEDTVIFVGDFCFKNSPGGKDGEGTTNNADYYRKQLNGNIVFVRGNHDNNNSLNTHITGIVMEIGGNEIYCVHDPVDSDPNWKINLVGHVHEKWKIKHIGRGITKVTLVNVGVDIWDFKPIDINDIMKEVENEKKHK